MFTRAKTSPFLPVVITICLALGYVFMGVWVRMMAGSFGTWQQVYLRILFAGLIAALVFRRRFTVRFLRDIRPGEWLIYILRGFLAYTVGVGFFTIAVQHAQLSTVSFVSSLPLLGLFAWLFYRERIKPVTIPFILASVVGLALLTGVDLRDFHLGWGETAAIIAMLGFDLGYILVRRQSKRFSNDQHTTIILLVSWIPVFAVSMWQGEALVPAHVGMQGWIGLVMASAFNVAGIFGLNYVFGHLKAYVVGNLLLLEGVFAAVIGFLFYGEIPGPRVFAGAVVILGCAYMISFIDARANRLEAAQTGEMT